MTPLADVLLAIGLAAVAVFFVSFLLWGLLPFYKPDLRPLPDDAAFVRAITPLNLEPGNYVFPQPDTPKDYKTDAFQARYDAGPWGVLRLGKARPNFGRNLAFTFLVYLGVVFLAAYLTSRAVAPGAEFLDVFQVAFTACALGFVFGGLPGDIFFSKSIGFIARELVGALAYAGVAAGVLSLMWP